MAKKNIGRKIWSSLYGIGEGILDTVSFGLTDNLTDKGYEFASHLGKASEEDIIKSGQFRDLGNIGGAVAGGLLTGNVKGAINEGAEGVSNFVGDTHADNWLKNTLNIAAY